MRHLAMNAENVCEKYWSEVSRGGGSFIILVRSSKSVVQPSYGWVPTASSISVIPKLQTSARTPYSQSLLATRSGWNYIQFHPFLN